MSTASVKCELEKYGLTPNRALGQNFLASDAAARTIAEAACENGCPVIEIGPGMGALTAELVKCAQRVAAIEIDRRMAEIIADRLPEVQLINEDALKADIPGQPFAEPAVEGGRPEGAEDRGKHSVDAQRVDGKIIGEQTAENTEADE